MENDISGRIVKLFTYRSKLNKHKKIIKMYVRRAQNNADGKGATFAFSLPLSKYTYDITNQALIRENAKTINISNAKDNEKSQKVNWWINELDSLGMKKSKQEEEESN
jgi:hypothetical protein